MWIEFNPGDFNDLEEAHVPMGDKLVLFKRGELKNIPDAIGAHLLQQSPLLYKPSAPPAQPSEPTAA